MSRAECIDNKGKFKACPYRTITEEHKAIMVGQGDIAVQSFLPCIGELCSGYHLGICLRLAEALQNQEHSSGKDDVCCYQEGDRKL